MNIIMEEKEFNLDEAKRFISLRMTNRKEEYNIRQLAIEDAVSQAIDADEEFLNTVFENNYCYSNDDQMENIQAKTGFDMNFIDLLLWYRHCYEMYLDMWIDDSEECIECRKGVLVYKEVEGELFMEKLVCKNCKAEMVRGENGLELL